MATCVGDGYTVGLHERMIGNLEVTLQITSTSDPIAPTSVSFGGGTAKIVVRVVAGTASLRHIEFDFSNIATIHIQLVGSRFPVFCLFYATNCIKFKQSEVIREYIKETLKLS